MEYSAIGAESTEGPPSDIASVVVMQQQPQGIPSSGYALYEPVLPPVPVEAEPKVIPPHYCQNCGAHPVSNLRSDKYCGHCLDYDERFNELESKLKDWNKQRELNRARLIRHWKVSGKPAAYCGRMEQIYDLASCILCHASATEIVSVMLCGIDVPIEGHYGMREFLFGACQSCSMKEVRIIEYLQEGNHFRIQKRGQGKPSFFFVSVCF